MMHYQCWFIGENGWEAFVRPHSNVFAAAVSKLMIAGSKGALLSPQLGTMLD